jgi:outer membrane protein OmpA-like peptidoglycan-associated protein
MHARQSRTASPAPPSRQPPPAARPVPSSWTRLATGTRVSSPHDADEQAADRAAGALLRGQAVGDVGHSAPGTLHRACAACESEEEQGPRVQASRTAGRGAAANAPLSPPSPLAPVGGGEALAPGVRGVMEAGFGQPLGGVRVHRGAVAAAAAGELGARAYTVGHHVVFGAGQFAPDSQAGRGLLAHELAHVLQGGSAVRRSAASGAAAGGEGGQGRPVGGTAPPAATPRPEAPQTCPPPPDLACEEARDTPADVRHDFQFAQDSALLTPLQISEIDAAALDWLGLLRTVTVRVDGYASAEGDCAYNWALSCRRAQAVAAELASPRMYGNGVPAANIETVAHGESDERGGALAPNRHATISMPIPEPDPEDQVSLAPPGHCGPDGTQWLVDQMNTNRNHPVIRTSREVQWPNYIPFFNLGWNYGFLTDFRDLVRAGAPWDFKSNQPQWRAGEGKPCPTFDCDHTVELCGECYNYDVPGNIHYGYIGREAGLRPWFLHNRADAAQAGGTDDPRDAVAIDIGIAMADDGATLCGQLGSRRSELNTEHTEGCDLCGPAPT